MKHRQAVKRIGESTFELSAWGYSFPRGWRPHGLRDRFLLLLMYIPISALQDWAFWRIYSFDNELFKIVHRAPSYITNEQLVNDLQNAITYILEHGRP